MSMREIQKWGWVTFVLFLFTLQVSEWGVQLERWKVSNWISKSFLNKKNYVMNI